MSKRKRKSNTISLSIGNDPTLWRFDSLNDALNASIHQLSQLIRSGEEVEHQTASLTEAENTNPELLRAVGD